MNKYGMEIMEEACAVCVAGATRNIRTCNGVIFNVTSQRNCHFAPPPSISHPPPNEPFATLEWAAWTLLVSGCRWTCKTFEKMAPIAVKIDWRCGFKRKGAGGGWASGSVIPLWFHPLARACLCLFVCSLLGLSSWTGWLHSRRSKKKEKKK